MNAGWSSLVARWAHNPKVACSNHAPATNQSVHFGFSFIYKSVETLQTYNRLMKSISNVFVCSVFVLSALAQNDNVVGTWKLISAQDIAENGTNDLKPYGPKPTGFLTYTADGRVSAIITHDGRKPLSSAWWWAGTMQERAESFSTVIAYAGRYTRNGDAVTHHIEACSFPNWVNTSQTRRILKVEGDRLTLRTQTPFDRNGVRYAYEELLWQRVK
jgi:hypothetical protein